MDTCPRCRWRDELEKLDREARLVEEGIRTVREGLRLDLRLDERLELVAEAHELELLLQRIEMAVRQRINRGRIPTRRMGQSLLVDRVALDREIDHAS
jgi:hypothetical protein